MNVTQTMADVNRYVITQLAHITVLVISTITSMSMDTLVCPAMVSGLARRINSFRPKSSLLFQEEVTILKFNGL